MPKSAAAVAREGLWRAEAARPYNPVRKSSASNRQTNEVMSSSPRHNRSAGARLSLVAFAALAFALVLAPAQRRSARAQDGAQKREAQPQREEILDDDEVLKIDTDLVLVEASVTDAEGRPVRGLRPEDFKLYEDGEERPVAFLQVARRAGTERPVAVVFVVDVSGSMTAEEMSRLQSAMRAFSEKLSNRPASFALMSFGMNARVLQSFTSDPRKLERAAERLAREANGLSTHTYDAIDDAVRLLQRNAPRTRERRLMKKAVVVVTDGFPVGDTVAPSTVIERANQAEVSVYTVTLPSYSRLFAAAEKEREPLPTPLDVSGMTEKTGGTNVYANTKDYEPLFKALAEEVTSTYVLAFYPPEEKRRDGLPHTIRVEAPRGLNVRQNRTGYKSSNK
jgi:VWFA-related protein